MRVKKQHQFRAALCAHKAAEVAGVCMVLMVQGSLAGLTLGHVGIATQTGLLAIVPVLGVTLTRWARHLVNRWTSSALLALFTFFADVAIHASHYPGVYTEAALTGIGAFFFSVVISFTRLGQYIENLGESLVHHGTHGSTNSRALIESSGKA